MWQKFALPLILAALLSNACNSAPVEMSPLPSPLDSPLPTTAPVSTATPMPPATPLSTMTLNSTILTAPIKTPEPTNTLTPLPIPSPISAGIAPLPGLFYKTDNGLWFVTTNSQVSHVITSESRYVSYSLAPNGDHILFWNWSSPGIWIANLTTGERLPLTPMAPYMQSPRWWTGRQDKLLLGTWEEGDDVTMSNGYLSEYDLAKSKLTILDHATFFWGAATSPDGNTVAYDGENKAWLYRKDTGRQPFDPQKYGLLATGGVGIGSPSWSPDGKQLAWIVGGQFAGEGERYGIAVFDLAKRTARLLHPYQIGGTDSWPDVATWSPDGHWLAFDAIASNPEEAGLWVTRVDGTEEHHLIRGPQSFVWSPDSRKLVFTTDREESGAWVTEIGTWHTQQLALPQGAAVVDWIVPPN